jgi:hypothetical protein
MATICNPFIVGGAVPPERFIGRRREINAIVAQLTGPALGSVAVHGDSRMGKTSLLDFLSSPRLARELPGEAFTLVRIDCASIEPFSIPLFWQTAKRELASQITSKSMSGLVEHWQDDWGTMSTSEVQQIFHDLQRAGHHPILMLDEFDSLISHARKAEDGARLLRTLRSLIGNRLIALVIATFRPLEEAIQGVKLEGQPFPSSFMPLGLTVFERSECDELIEAALRDSPITFDADDRDYVYEVSAGHPYWLQFACFRLFEEKHIAYDAITKASEVSRILAA